MIVAGTAKAKKIALFGLGGSGMITAQSLMAGGADLVCYDDNPDSVAAAKKAGLPTGDLREVDFSQIDELVLSPGVPLTHPKPHWSVELAKKAKIPIIGDIEIFCRERRQKSPDCPFIAITGTNGKSTTTALFAHIARSAGLNVQMGGNIGTAILSLDEPAPDRFYVVEVSSYQIDLAPSLDPGVGVLLNISPDHLERHGNLENYAGIKQRLVTGAAHAIIGVDDEFGRAISEALKAKGHALTRIAGYGEKGELQSEGEFISYDKNSNQLIEHSNGKSKTLFDMAAAPGLRGAHNGQNAAAAWAACRQIGIEPEAIKSGFESFPGLVHRMELVARRGHVLFVNDSKATNVDAAAHALSSFDHIYWIAGGLAKQGGIEDLKAFFPKIDKAYLIGEAAPRFAASLGNACPFEISATLENAIARASEDASKNRAEEAVVLLSPACASFDQFKNFEKRGEAFRNQVLNLPDTVPFKEMLS